MLDRFMSPGIKRARRSESTHPPVTLINDTARILVTDFIMLFNARLFALVAAAVATSQAMSVNITGRDSFANFFDGEI
jgi:hypothetical protein